MSLYIQAIPSGPFDTNAYIVACDETKQAVVVDPSPNSAPSILKTLQQEQLQAASILLTHSHWDHIADVAEVKEALMVPVGVHPLDAPNLEQPGSDGLPCWIKFPGIKPDFYLEEGQELRVGNVIFKVIHTPGHTPGGVAFYSSGAHVLLSGDTLFKGTIGNLSFPGCDAEAMWRSLGKLALLPPDTRVYPGHGPATTIGSESWLSNAKHIFGG